jgi:hypothetical protein
MAGGSISQARSWLDATLNRFLMMLDSWSGGAQPLPRRVSGPARIDGLPFSRVLHDKLRFKGAPQPRAITYERSMTGGIIMDDDSATSRRNLLLGVGSAGLLAAGIAASSPQRATA